MDYHLIHRLNQTLPELPPAALTDAARNAPEFGALKFENPEASFLKAYFDPAFGWKAAGRLAQAGERRFPLYPQKKLRWVYNAWLLLSDEANYRKHKSMAPIQQAYEIYTDPSYSVIRGVMEAALITRDGTVAEIASSIKMSADVVEAYDALFYNVLDRKEDAMFLRQVVYPFTRLEEALEQYLSHGNLNKMLLRLGYNKGLDQVLYYAGFHTNFVDNISTSQAQELFQKELLIHGYLLTCAGFLNFDRQHISISSARALVQASKLGGEVMGSDHSTGVFAEIVGAQLENDGNTMRAKINRSLLEV